MIGSELGTKIHDAITSAYGAAQDDGKLVQFCNALGTAIVEYIQANGVVEPGTLFSSPGGGPLGGTGTIS
jgi:hypothetical protein